MEAYRDNDPEHVVNGLLYRLGIGLNKTNTRNWMSPSDNRRIHFENRPGDFVGHNPQDKFNQSNGISFSSTPLEELVGGLTKQQTQIIFAEGLDNIYEQVRKRCQEDLGLPINQSTQAEDVLKFIGT